jgi:hypothetical protein
MLGYHDTCFVAIKEKNQFDVIYHVMHALSPADVHVITNKHKLSNSLMNLRS